jgi:hypothetical protein
MITMARETKAQKEQRIVQEAHDAGFTSVEDYEASLKVDAGSENGDSSNGDKNRRNLSPEALGFVASEVQDIPFEELPDFGMRDSKYAEYIAALTDSYNKGEKLTGDAEFQAWKRSNRVDDPHALAAAIRNAAVRMKIGAEIRIDKDEATLEPNGYVYFCGRPVRERNVAATAE